MINSIKARTPILALILFVFAVGYTFAAQQVVVIPLGADDVQEEALPLAYGFIGPDGEVLTGYGITSVTLASNVYTITIDKSFTGYPVVTATSYGARHNAEIVSYSSVDGGNLIRIRIVDDTNAPTVSGFSFVAYGTSL